MYCLELASDDEAEDKEAPVCSVVPVAAETSGPRSSFPRDRCPRPVAKARGELLDFCALIFVEETRGEGCVEIRDPEDEVDGARCYTSPGNRKGVVLADGVWRRRASRAAGEEVVDVGVLLS